MSVAFADPSILTVEDYRDLEDTREAVTVNIHITAISKDKSFPPFYSCKKLRPREL